MIICRSRHLPLRIKETFDADPEIQAHSRPRRMVGVHVVLAGGPVKRRHLSVLCFQGVEVAGACRRFAQQVHSCFTEARQRQPKVKLAVLI